MIRTGASTLAAAAALAALAGLPAVAAEGGAIRAGEHDGFTRVVMVVEPTTEWSLETSAGEAVLLFPGRRISFGTQRAFERIPRTRVTAIESRPDENGTRVAVGLGCDCRISASFIGARYLALDISDRDAPHIAADTVPIPEESAEDRSRREVAAVASAEEALLAQITRAADQGVIRLSAEGSPPQPVAPAPRPAPAATVSAARSALLPAAAALDPAGQIRGADKAATNNARADEVGTHESETHESGTDEAGADSLAALAFHDQVTATSVYDRDLAAVLGRRPEPPLPAVCLPDEDFGVETWSDGTQLSAQTPALMRKVIGEFDRVDPEALRDLARLYVRFGFGAEAETLLADFETDFDGRDLIADLARTVEGRPVASDGPLALDAACPGRHALWLALGGAAPAFHDAEQFAAVQNGFAEMPPDLRQLLGPTLANALLDAGRPEEARLIFITATRQGAPNTAELDLVAARLDAAEGRPDEALAEMRALAESNAPNATDALLALVRLALDTGVALPPRLVTDLRGAALTQRGAPGEPAIRGLLVEALAAQGALRATLAEVRAAQADLPQFAPAFAALGVTALAETDPAAVGEGAYVETALAAEDLITTDIAGDPARNAIATRLSEVGLPNAALDLLGPAIARGDPASLRLAAGAQLALGEPETALATLAGLDGPEALSLRAAALARSGAPQEAVDLLAASGDEAEALPYAWPSGDWTRARAAAGEANPIRAAMAGFMAAQDGDAPAPAPADPATLSAEAAFEAPLPALAQPSLGASRTLLANGRQVGGLVDALLKGD